jgi:starch synthase
LADTVQDGITGYTFLDFDAGAFWKAIERATWTYNVDPQSWRQIQRNGMKSDFSWSKSAQSYQQLYEWAIAGARD